MDPGGRRRKPVMDINGIFTPQAAPGIPDAIHGAAAATGASFQYMLAAAQAESGLNPHAASATSSARGLYQFIDQTWLATMKRSGAALGYARYSDAIVQTAAGRYEVPDLVLRRDVMALRDDPAANAAMAGALTQDNAAKLANRLGRAPTDGELYIAHVLGAAGAARLTALAGTNPGAMADAAFPTAADANRALFYDRQGRARTVAEVRDALIGRFENARVSATAPFDLVTAVTNVLAALNPTEAAAETALGPAVAAPDSGEGPDAAAASGPLAAPTLAAGQARAPLFQSLFSDSGSVPSQFVADIGARRAGVRRQVNPAPQPAPAGAIRRAE